MFKFLRLVLKRNSGFTLVETLVAVAITGLVATAIAASIFQVVTVNASTVNRESALKQVENAVQYISRDAQQTQNVTTAGGNFPLTLKWVAWSGDSYVVVYSIAGTAMNRSQTLNGGTAEVLKVADKIDGAAGTNTCSWASGTLTVTLTSSTGGFKPVSESRTFQIAARSVR